jgi:hypothetical protein
MEQSILGGKEVQSIVVNEVIKIGNNVVMWDCFIGLVIIIDFVQAQVGNISEPSQL